MLTVPDAGSVAATERWIVRGLLGEVWLFDAATGLLLRTFSSPTPMVGTEFGLSVGAVGSRVMVSDPTVGMVHQFDGESGALLRSFMTPGLSQSFEYPLLPFGSQVLVGIPGAVYMFDGDTGELRRTFRVDDDFEFGRRVAVDGNDVHAYPVGSEPYNIL